MANSQRQPPFSKLYNTDPDSITNDAAEAFIDLIDEELGKGFGFVPFIGAGLSAPSGAPPVWDITTYLNRCIGLALGVEQLGMRRWNPRTDQWPPFVDRDRIGRNDWFNQVLLALEERRSRDPGHPELAVFQEAVGAMAEWRTALLFLSRLVHDKRGAGFQSEELLALDAPHQDVLDAGIREALKGKYPTLEHRMLAALGIPLRLDVILTTNFDDLLERAFVRAKNPVTVFDVPLNGTLPPWSALSSQRSLVKLHGTRHSLRADYTLDALPSESDRWRFLEYLVSPEGRERVTSQCHPDYNDPLPPVNHLLVMGVAATERRTRSFIEHAWRHLKHEFKVLWLCHTTADVAKVQTFTEEFLVSHHVSHLPKDWKGSHILRYTHLGLFFLQLYQTIRRALPTSGIIFPTVSRLAVPPFSRRTPGKRDAQRRAVLPEVDGAATLITDIEKRLMAFRAPRYPFTKLVVVSSHADVQGVTSVCAQVYDRHQKDDMCLWIDMNDISSTDNLFEQLFDAAYYRLGVETWMPVFVPKDPLLRANEIRRLAHSTTKPWLIFLNARETPGANTEIDQQLFNPQHRPNNWLDVDHTTARPRSGSGTAFSEFLTALCGAQSSSISVILLCRNKALPPTGRASARTTTQADDIPPIIHILKRNGLIRDALTLQAKRTRSPSGGEDKVITKALKWTRCSPARRRFLHSLCLMQRTRFLATVWTAVVSPQMQESARSNDELLIEWLNELEDIGLVRRKPGGFIWLHTRPRNRLRNILGDRREQMVLVQTFGSLARLFSGDGTERRPKWDSEGDAAEIHRELAEWYRRVLAASDAPAAVFEAVYHACRAARSSLHALKKDDVMAHARRLIQWAASLLHFHRFLVQTHGYSRGSCRCLEYIRDSLCSDVLDRAKNLTPRQCRSTKGDVNRDRAELRAAILLLRVRATEVMRAIAREVGEDGTTYLRQCEIVDWTAGRKLFPDAGRGERLFSALFRSKSASRSLLRFLGDPCVEWIRWWRWNGMLGIASRSYPKARTALLRALLSATRYGEREVATYPLTRRPQLRPDQIAAEIRQLINRWTCADPSVFGRRSTDGQQLRLEIVRVIEQIVAEELQRSSLLRRLSQDKPKASDSTENFASIRSIIVAGLELIDQVLSHGHSSDAHYSVPAMWSKSRLLMHESMCLAGCAKWTDAMKLLANADSCLNFSDTGRQGTDRAVIELHRAEVRLLQAGATRLRSSPTVSRPSVSFDEFRKGFTLDPGHSLLWPDAGNQCRAIVLKLCSAAPKALVVALREPLALIQDSLDFLGRAEQLLLNRRRHVWWTTWLFQRKLRAISMSVWATVLEEGTPIPFLGLEAAPRLTPTVADTVLDDASRMIRVDAYRFATIVSEYASCATALHFRLMLDPKAVRLPERQRYMHARLELALSQLKDVRKAREEYHDKTSDYHYGAEAAMDGSVRDYIIEVINHCEDAAMTLKNALATAAHVPTVPTTNGDK